MNTETNPTGPLPPGLPVPPGSWVPGQSLLPEPVPLRMDERGALRVGGSRVLLDLVIKAHREGASPETIVRWFESLQLADVYAVIAFYLHHQEQVEDYLRRREQEAADLRRELEATGVSRPSFREELKARKAHLEGGNAAAGR